MKKRAGVQTASIAREFSILSDQPRVCERTRHPCRRAGYFRDVLGFRVGWEDAEDWRLVQRDGDA
jgi:hypothetical protein